MIETSTDVKAVETRRATRALLLPSIPVVEAELKKVEAALAQFLADPKSDALIVNAIQTSMAFSGSNTVKRTRNTPDGFVNETVVVDTKVEAARLVLGMRSEEKGADLHMRRDVLIARLASLNATLAKYPALELSTPAPAVAAPRILSAAEIAENQAQYSRRQLEKEEKQKAERAAWIASLTDQEREALLDRERAAVAAVVERNNAVRSSGVASNEGGR